MLQPLEDWRDLLACRVGKTGLRVARIRPLATTFYFLRKFH
ncbi:MAG: hypothetical protein R6U67_16885 [Sodalinema sp.]